ncbi:DUF2834 domain-containing protein [Leptospira wolffii]|uniref:DUF2834 domain-containing protein n=1 Tax=Leptospira wolffii TaxID=409998 RepID=UPI0002EA9549|nr:DUF2834 domain-containing protein [Leptospira wolffii]EPG67024.1 PF11196 family protein [Leptospira wolffii serovar Khorat str. Khorat-H2]
MNWNLTKWILLSIATLFTISLAYLVTPPLSENFDLVGAFGGGFVNPFSSGYALDVIFTWCALAIWVLYEAKVKGIKNGWIALVLGVVPGVAAGLVFYIILREKQRDKIA